MLAYFLDKETKRVAVFTNPNPSDAIVKATGAVEMDVEQGYDGNWYVTGYAPTQPFPELRTAALSTLNSAFTDVESGAWVQSSLGFKADANTTANTNIDGLIKSMSALGTESTLFCDYDNVFHTVTLDDLKILQLEVIQNGQALYAQKWSFREAINAAMVKEELDAISIEFVMMDFTPKTEV